MSDKRTPNWQPVSNIPLIAQMIDGMLHEAMEHYATLQEAVPKPHVLDDYTVNRIIKVFTQQQEDLPLYDEQLRRWKAAALTTNQNQEVERLQKQLAQLRENITKILTLAQQLKKGTIENQLGKTDLQIGLESLLKPLPKRKPIYNAINIIKR